MPHCNKQKEPKGITVENIEKHQYGKSSNQKTIKTKRQQDNYKISMFICKILKRPPSSKKSQHHKIKITSLSEETQRRLINEITRSQG